MAQKKSRTKTKKKTPSRYPVQRSTQLEVPGTAANAVKILDTAAELSKLNRRLYRFGRYYEVSINQDPTGPGTENYSVYVLRDDWMVHKGFQHAYRAYLNATADERANMSSSQIARWEDFRVDHGIGAHDTLRSRQFDKALTGFNLSLGEFALSQVVDAAGTTRTFTWSDTPGAAEYGVLVEYDKAGNAQASPSSLVAGAAGPYAGLEDGNDPDVYTDLEALGDEPPYDRDGVNAGTPWTKVAHLGTMPNGGQRLGTGFFTAPCGLVLIVANSLADEMTNISMTVKSGDYKGVHAPSMLE